MGNLKVNEYTWGEIALRILGSFLCNSLPSRFWSLWPLLLWCPWLPTFIFSGQCHYCSTTHFLFDLSSNVSLPADTLIGFPGSLDGKESAFNVGDLALIPGWRRSPGGGHANPLQYSCLENPLDRGAWQTTVHGVANSWTQLSIVPWWKKVVVKAGSS